ncbi:hypothetical protein X801_05306, partial [Opisthorchis viverrini]
FLGEDLWIPVGPPCESYAEYRAKVPLITVIFRKVRPFVSCRKVSLAEISVLGKIGKSLHNKLSIGDYNLVEKMGRRVVGNLIALRLEKDTGAALVEEIECSTPNVAYYADHFNYQMFSGTAATANGLKNKSALFARPGLVVRQLVYKLRSINWNSAKQQLFSKQNSYTKRGSAKFKVAQWYQSCTHRTMRDWLGTRSFISTVAPAIGGIWILDKNATNETGASGNTNSTVKWPNRMFQRYDISTNIPMKPDWSWMNATKKLQTILHVPVFVDFNVQATPGSQPQVYFVPDGASWMTAGYFS